MDSLFSQIKPKCTKSTVPIEALACCIFLWDHTALHIVFNVIFLHVSALKSTENCVCILHNLSYQMEAELPKTNSRDLPGTRQNLAPNPQAVGCFAQRSAKITEVIPLDNNPHWRYKGCVSAY